jgi:hypothetical protein
MDTFFLGGKFDRRGIVATKATCQVASHFVKLIYFGGIIDQAATLDPVLAAVAVAASMTGTTLARRILEAMTDTQFLTWAGRLITTVASYYIIYGSWLLLVEEPCSCVLTEGEARWPIWQIRWCSISSNGSPASPGFTPR